MIQVGRWRFPVEERKRSPVLTGPQLGGISYDLDREVKTQNDMYLMLCQALKETVLPIIGKEPTLLIADYVAHHDLELLKPWKKGVCSWNGCNETHRRRISNLCDRHSTRCVACGKRETHGPREPVCQTCRDTGNHEFIIREVHADRYQLHHAHHLYSSERRWISEWAKEVGIVWHGPCLLPADEVHKKFVLDRTTFPVDVPRFYISNIDSFRYLREGGEHRYHSITYF